MSFHLKHVFIALICVSLLAGCAQRDGKGLETSTAGKIPEESKEPEEPEYGIAFSKGPVSVKVLPGFGKLNVGQGRDLNLLLQVAAEGDGLPVKKHQPLNLALIIDRSGSMSGEKLKSVKIAAMELVGKLNEQDLVTLVSYSDNVRFHARSIPLDEAGKTLLKNEILGLYSGGGTALGPATIETIAYLNQHKNEGGRMTHMLLLSDGIANIGEDDPQVLGAHTARAFGSEISLSTLGVGLNYNEDLMTHMADLGGGQYHFVKDNNMIAGVLNDELSGLMATSARQVRVEMRLARGVTLEKVYGYPQETVGGVTTIRVGSLRADQRRDIVAKIKLSPSAVGQSSIGEFKVRFSNVLKDGVAQETGGQLSLAVVADDKSARASEVFEVTVRAAEVEAAAHLELAARAVDRGDFNSADQTLAQSIQVLEKQAKATPSKRLDDQIEEMKTARKGIDEAKASPVMQKSYVKSNKSKAYKKRQGKKKHLSKEKWKKKKEMMRQKKQAQLKKK